MLLTAYDQKQCPRTSIQVPLAKAGCPADSIIVGIECTVPMKVGGKQGEVTNNKLISTGRNVNIKFEMGRFSTRSVSRLCVVCLRWCIEVTHCVDYHTGCSLLLLLSHQAQAGSRILIVHFSYQMCLSCFISFPS